MNIIRVSTGIHKSSAVPNVEVHIWTAMSVDGGPLAKITYTMRASKWWTLYTTRSTHRTYKHEYNLFPSSNLHMTTTTSGAVMLQRIKVREHQEHRFVTQTVACSNIQMYMSAIEHRESCLHQHAYEHSLC